MLSKVILKKYVNAISSTENRHFADFNSKHVGDDVIEDTFFAWESVNILFAYKQL